jgi:hypothetical protein
VDLDVVHVLNQVLQDYIHDNEDEDDVVAYHIVDKGDNKFVVVAAAVAVVVVVQKQQHLYHDHTDMHLQEHNNLYFQKNHYREFFCIKNWYLLLMVDVLYLFDVMVMNVKTNRLMNVNMNVVYV